MINKHPKDALNSNIRNYIAKVVFTYTQTMGLTDRKELEDIVDKVISRLEDDMLITEQGKSQKVEPALPGMEHLVSQPAIKLPPHEKIENHVNEILSEKIAQKQNEKIEKSVLKKDISKDESSIKEADDSSKQDTKDLKISKQDLISHAQLKLSDNAITVLTKRYLSKDNQGNIIETPEELFRRVSKYIASAELIYDTKADAYAWEEKFYSLMTSFDFLPNSPTLMNAGRELGQLSACFVLPIEDTMESIFDAVKYTALIHKSGGGTGFSFSRIRPKQDRVGSTGGVASGPVSFMRAFDTATDVIKQGGMRRGANMGILNIDHPDILEFISSKEKSDAFTNFNISVAVTDSFMKSVDKKSDYELINPHTKEVAGNLNAGEVFRKIADTAWRTGDPGIIFIDRINEFNSTPQLGKIESTNPCGEQPLLPFESCNLGSVNLANMVTGVDEGSPEINFNKLKDTVKLAVRFLDNVIEVNQFPLPQIAEMSRKTRKIGLGVMGFADMLILLRIPYNSGKAVATAEKVMQFISIEAFKESVALGLTRGAFPSIKGSIYDTINGPQLRNANRTTIAPTGTLSIIAGCSSGIEPLFALGYKRHILDGESLVEVNPYFEQIARQEIFYSQELINKISNGTSLKDIPEIPMWIKEVFITSHDISPQDHIKIQAAFQKYTDSAVSKTVNLPEDATIDDVENIYLLAYKSGLKGITIYRDNSKSSQVLTTGKTKEPSTLKANLDTKLTPRDRPKVTRGITERVTTGCGYIYVTVNFDDRGICEVFSSLGKAGGCASAQLEATCRLISLIFRSGIEVSAVIKQLRAIRCPSVSWENGRAILSCADAIGSVLERYVQSEGTSLPLTSVPSGNTGGQCPDCGNLLIYQEGCHHCPNCGYTKCG